MLSVVHHEGRSTKTWFLFEMNGIDCVIARIHVSRKSILQKCFFPKKWRKKFSFLSPHVGRPGKAFLDHVTISKLYPWAKANIKCSNRKKLAWERPPLCRTAASNITHSAIADQDYSLLPTCTCSMHVAHSTAVHCCAAVRRCVGLHCA